MTKRAYKKFERNERDFYATPEAAVLPLLPHVEHGTSFDEPCAGDGALVGHLIAGGLVPAFISDIEPRSGEIACRDALDRPFCQGSMFITNPPWDRKILHPLITHLSDIAPTWLLFDSDWMHTKQAAPFMQRLKKIVSVGRVSWFGDTVGFDNCAWYLFDKPSSGLPVFVGRTPFEPTIVS